MIEVIIFTVFALVALAGAVVMITARNPVYSAMGLLSTMFAMAIGSNGNLYFKNRSVSSNLWSKWKTLGEP